MNCSGWFRFFDFNCILTPFSMQVTAHQVGNDHEFFKNYRIFGFRIARIEVMRGEWT